MKKEGFKEPSELEGRKAKNSPFLTLKFEKELRSGDDLFRQVVFLKFASQAL